MRFLLLFTLCAIVSPLWAQLKYHGTPFIQSFEADTYQGGARCTAITETSQGLKFFGHNSGLAVFDGQNWENLSEFSHYHITALQASEQRIYVGSEQHFGYLQQRSDGTWYFVNLSQKISPKHRDFQSVKRIILMPDKVVFQADTKLFIYDTERQRMQIFTAENLYDLCFLVEGRLYVREWGKGLLIFENDKLQLLDNTKRFAYEHIALLFAKAHNHLGIINREGRFYDYHLDLETLRRQRVGDSISQFLKENMVYSGLRLKSGEIALGTSQGGLILLSQSLKVMQRVNTSTGLPSNTVNEMMQDEQGNLWLATENGVAYVQINAPFYFFGKKNGIKGRVINSVLHQGHLYVGTSEGIFFKPWQFSRSTIKSHNQFMLVEGSEGQAGKVFSYQGVLIYAHSQGVMMVNGDKARPLIANESAYDFLSPQQNPNLLLVGKYHGGLSVLSKREDTWVFRNYLEEFSHYVNDMQQDSLGYIWFSDYRKGIFRLKLDSKLEGVIELRHYDKAKGLPTNSRNSLVKENGQIYILTKSGIYRYYYPLDKFVLADSLNEHLFNPTYVDYLQKDQQGMWWFLQYGMVGCNLPSKHKTLPVFGKLKQALINHITFLPNQHVLFGGKNGLFVFNRHHFTRRKENFRVYWRQISSHSDQQLDSLLSQQETVNLPYEFANLYFSFWANDYENREQLHFQSRLEGLEENWTKWSPSAKREYRNLREGWYRLHIRAKNAYGQISKEAVFTFRVLPPWYRNIWAYLLYIGLALLGVGLLLRLNSWRLRRQNLFLEAKIKDGLAEISRQNAELAQKNQSVELLNDISQDINQHLSVELIVERLYSNINRLMDASVFGIGVYRAEEGFIEFVGAKEGNQTLPPLRFDLKDKDKLASWVVRHRQAIFIRHLNQEYSKYLDQMPEPTSGDQNAQSIMYVPLESKGNFIGMLTVQSFRANAYSAYQFNILKNLAGHISIALDNAKAYEELTALNQEKNYLIGVVAHDLRNPLHNIYGMANVLQLNSNHFSDKQKRYLTQIIDTTSRINQMIDKILDTKAIDEKRLKIEFSEISLKELLYKILQSFQGRAQQKQIQLRYDGSHHEHPLQLDEGYAQQIFENLLSNAIKFSPFGHNVLVRGYKQEGFVGVEVLDEGPGIPQEEFPKLFGKFQRLSTRPTNGESSTGLGLSIVKKYVEAMQGRVWAENRPQGGARFVVEFPQHLLVKSS